MDPPPFPPQTGAREFEAFVEEVRRARPGCDRALDRLFVPLLSKLKFDAPSPPYALGMLAKWAEKQSDEVLTETLRRLTTPGELYRRVSVKPSDIEDALRAAIEAAKEREQIRAKGILFNGTPEFDEVIAKVAEHHPGQAEWLRMRKIITPADLAKYRDTPIQRHKGPP